MNDQVRIVLEGLELVDSHMHDLYPEDWTADPLVLLEAATRATAIAGELSQVLDAGIRA